MPPYRIVKNASAWWPVTMPAFDDAGEIVDQTFEVRFVQIAESQLGEVYNAEIKDADFFDRLVKDWRGILGDDGQPLPFTPANRDVLLDTANFAVTLSRAYLDFFRMRREKRLGNSEAPLAGGPVAAAAPTAPTPATATE